MEVESDLDFDNFIPPPPIKIKIKQEPVYGDEYSTPPHPPQLVSKYNVDNDYDNDDDDINMFKSLKNNNKRKHDKDEIVNNNVKKIKIEPPVHKPTAKERKEKIKQEKPPKAAKTPKAAKQTKPKKPEKGTIHRITALAKKQNVTGFEAQFGRGGIMTKLLDCTQKLVTDMNIDIDQKGIHMTSMDTSHVSMIEFSIIPKALQHFRCVNKVVLGIHTNSVFKLLKGMDDYYMTWTSAEEPDVLSVILEDYKDKRITDKLRIPLMDISADKLDASGIKYDVEITLLADDFDKIVRMMALISDKLLFTVKLRENGEPAKLLIIANNKLKGRRERTLVESDDVKFYISDKFNPDIDPKDEEQQRALMEEGWEEGTKEFYSIKYLIHFCKAKELTRYITLKMKRNVPLACEYNITSTDNRDQDKLIQLRYHLAPNMANDELDEYQSDDD
jgi:proliferating cell nuclear antigen